MTPIVLAAEFEICVSMADFVRWTAEDAPVANADLQAVFDVLRVRIEILRIHREYFDDAHRSGRGDVHVYAAEDDPDTVVALDLYSDPHDQLDLVNLYMRCKPSSATEVAQLVSVFFNRASAQIHASQQSVSTRLRKAIDKTQYPRSVLGTEFAQRQIHHDQ